VPINRRDGRVVLRFLCFMYLFWGLVLGNPLNRRYRVGARTLASISVITTVMVIVFILAGFGVTITITITITITVTIAIAFTIAGAS